ncbi:MAG: retroviral-like aspartic protease family protein [Sphingomonadales bacterium]|nr:retroviral-like aspartic protease family protein [Sphingomonadales bacterium]
MPITNCGFSDSDNYPACELLVAHGPTLIVDVGFVESDHPGHEDESRIKNVPALVDTGASDSCIDEKLAEELGLPAVDRISIAGVSGGFEVNLYLARVHLPQLDVSHYGRFASVKLQEGGQNHGVLIGRSFLRHIIMIYDGIEGRVTMSI